jgi:hypothetical protein
MGGGGATALLLAPLAGGHGQRGSSAPTQQPGAPRAQLAPISSEFSLTMHTAQTTAKSQ